MLVNLTDGAQSVCVRCGLELAATLLWLDCLNIGSNMSYLRWILGLYKWREFRPFKAACSQKVTILIFDEN